MPGAPARRSSLHCSVDRATPSSSTALRVISPVLEGVQQLLWALDLKPGEVREKQRLDD
jgi:hypothetical protein